MVSQNVMMDSIKGHLQIKNDRYQMVINYKNENGEWKQKSKTTGLTTKGNKKRAQDMLVEYEQTLKRFATVPALNGNPFVLFSDYMEQWLKEHWRKIKPSTRMSYQGVVHGSIIPYFEKTNITLVGLKPNDISEYYNHLLDQGIGANTIKRHHANIRKALDVAFKKELIDINPADRVDLPRVKEFHADFYTQDELNELLNVLHEENHWLEDIVLICAFYGLRRSEAIGLRWQSIDFRNDEIKIEHTVTPAVDENGLSYWAFEDDTKNGASLRRLPLVNDVKRRLLERKQQQELYMDICGDCYSQEFTDYVFVDELGFLITPDRTSRNFKIFLSNHNLKHIRFHDLRHSCASLLLSRGVQIKEIQKWLGHSKATTTANIYAHLADNKKAKQMDTMRNALFGDILIA